MKITFTKNLTIILQQTTTKYIHYLCCCQTISNYELS